ncbi:SDR family NAD(P)-dependent oxidoreductase [Acidisoma sp.]|uniref:SDR family NAD(P)-dependent oxidoreductase n=1 Tax=Acidisoma sp. TaxID=1872115 RepID=UPI003B002B70
MTGQPKRVGTISGASRGIGAAIASHLGAAGWDLSLGMRRPSALASAPDALLNSICNAGVMFPKSAITATEAEMAAMFNVNVFAPQRLAQAAWKGLAASGRGRIVVIASLSGKRVASANSGAYAMSKFAALGLTHALRHAGWEQGIRATAICPGFVATDKARAITDMDPAAMTQPEDVARLVQLALDLPNTASVPEIGVNARIEGSL